MNRELFVGFKGKNNTSYQLVNRLEGDKLFLTNSFEGVRRDIESLCSDYEICYLFGVDKNLKDSIRIEKTAEKNGKEIVSDLMLSELQKTFEMQGIKTVLSETSTSYLCNEAYFNILEKMNGNAVLIHIPSIGKMTVELLSALINVIKGLNVEKMKTDEVLIRVAKLEDAKALLEIYAPYAEKTAITFEYEVPSLEEFEKRMQEVMQKYPYLIAELNGEICGYTYASAFKARAAYAWSVETSIYVKADRRCLGIGGKLYEVLEKCLAEQGILNANACIAYSEKEDEYLTKDSVKFHEKMGYQLVARFHKCGYKYKRWYDMIWMEKHIGEHVENQPVVKDFDEIKGRVF